MPAKAFRLVARLKIEADGFIAGGDAAFNEKILYISVAIPDNAGQALARSIPKQHRDSGRKNIHCTLFVS
jgi:hypothetical protein